MFFAAGSSVTLVWLKWLHEAPKRLIFPFAIRRASSISHAPPVALKHFVDRLEGDAAPAQIMVAGQRQRLHGDFTPDKISSASLMKIISSTMSPVKHTKSGESELMVLTTVSK